MLRWGASTLVLVLVARQGRVRRMPLRGRVLKGRRLTLPLGRVLMLVVVLARRVMLDRGRGVGVRLLLPVVVLVMLPYWLLLDGSRARVVLWLRGP
jgi:hypothetical protein